MSLDPTKSLMQNLKDIKRVVDSFLGDKEEEASGPSFLRKNMEERIKTPESEVVENLQPTQITSKNERTAAKPKKERVIKKKPIASSTLGKVATASVFSNSDKSSPFRSVTQGKGAINRKSVVNANSSTSSNNKGKIGRIAPVNQTSFNSVGMSTNNKFGKATRSKKV